MSRTSLTVHVNKLEAAPELRRQDVARAVAAALAGDDVASGEISVSFVDAAAIGALNLKHLGRAGPTDVLAFQLGEPRQPLGDIYVCPEIARQSAVDYGVAPREELLRLVVHGTLHLLGYEHPEGPERAASDMYRRQEAILADLTGGQR